MIAKNQKIKKNGGIVSPKVRLKVASLLLWGFLAFIVIFFIYSNINISRKTAQYASKAKELREQIAILEKKNNDLKLGINQTENASYQEEIIRDQGYKKPGETAVVVLPLKTEEVNVENNNKGFWSNLWNKIIFWK